jgi:hypothetical protein
MLLQLWDLSTGKGRLERLLRSRWQCTLKIIRRPQDKERKKSKTLKSNLLISVSNLILHTSSSNVLKLNCGEAQSKTHTLNRCLLSSPLTMTMLVFVFVRAVIRPRPFKHRSTMSRLFVWGTQGQQRCRSCIFYWVLYWNAQGIQAEGQNSLPSDGFLLGSTTASGLLLLGSQMHFCS